MNVKLKKFALGDGASQLHLVFPGATGHVPSEVLISLAQTGDVVYLEGAYPDISDSSDTEKQRRIIRPVIDQIIETMPVRTKITHAHIYCAGILPASVILPVLREIGLLASMDLSIACYDPPFYAMPAGSMSELCEKLFNSFILGLTALFTQNGLPAHLPFTHYSQICESPKDVTEFLLDLKTRCGLFFDKYSQEQKLASDYCDNLIMQTQTPPTKESICALGTLTLRGAHCYFSEDAAAQEEEIQALKRAAGPAAHISTHSGYTHAALMNVTSFMLASEYSRERMPETGRSMVTVPPPRHSGGGGSGRYSPPRPMLKTAPSLGAFGALFGPASSGLLPPPVPRVACFNGSTASVAGDKQRTHHSPGADAETGSAYSGISSVSFGKMSD